MSNIAAVASSPPSTGITRDVDLTLATNSGTNEIGAAPSTTRELRGALTAGGQTGVGISSVSTLLAAPNGRLVWNVTSGLGNGAMIQYGVPITTILPTNKAAYSLRRGVVRVISTLFADSAQTPNNDVGMQIVIGGGTLAQLLANNNVSGPGKSGYGIWMIANKWVWGIKLVNTAQGVLSEAIDLGLTVTQENLIEIRTYDAVDTLKPAKVELYINNVLILTRYWVNPAGVVTPTLPPFSAANGVVIYGQIRNTSTGPANCYFGDFSVIHGPNNEGTTSNG